MTLPLALGLVHVKMNHGKLETSPIPIKLPIGHPQLPPWGPCTSAAGRDLPASAHKGDTARKAEAASMKADGWAQSQCSRA